MGRDRFTRSVKCPKCSKCFELKVSQNDSYDFVRHGPGQRVDCWPDDVEVVNHGDGIKQSIVLRCACGALI